MQIGASVAPQSSTVDESEVRKQLAAILESGPFRGSKRCHDFLLFAVEKTLKGEMDSLKERTLAVEVFGRKTSAPLGDDSIVRVGAREVRKRLAQYYVTDGAHDQLRIELPAGSYIPVFHLNPPAAPPAEPVLPDTVAVPATVGKRKVNLSLLLAVALVAVSIVAGALFWLRPKHNAAPVATEFEAFWQPLFAQSTPVLIGLAHPLVYHPSDRLSRLDEQLNGPQPILQRPIHVTSDVKASDFVPVSDQYVGFGDAVAATKMTLLLAQHGRSAKLRLASKLDFDDLRDSATILIGAFTNRWAAEVTKDLRYRFERGQSKPWIIDSQTGRKWLVEGKAENGQAKDDYLLLCRLTHSETGKILVVAAGLTQYGTQEAGSLLTDPEALTHVLERLPSNWRDKNVQIVLYSHIVGDTPTAPEPVAYYVW